MGAIGPLEIFLVFIVVLLLFGAKGIPRLARGLGEAIREFRHVGKEISGELQDATNEVNETVSELKQDYETIVEPLKKPTSTVRKVFSKK